jgi:hypothetical protein
MVFVRATVPVLHFFEVGGCAFVGHAERIADCSTKQTSFEFIKHQPYIKKA